MVADPKIADFRDRMLRLDTAASVQELFKNVDLARVEEVALSGNTFGLEAAKELGSLLRQMVNLKIAQLSSIFITRGIDEIPPALTALCDALTECSKLVEVDLSNNAFGRRSVDPVVPLLSTNLSLEIVKIANTGLNFEGGRVVANALVASANKSKELGQPSKLRVLVCSKNRLEDGSAAAWSKAIAAHTNLQHLEMSNTCFREDGIMAIASGLLHCPDLRYLDLRDNLIATFDEREGERGYTAIADVIRGSESLQFLCLGDCLLRDEGCEAVMTALGHRSFTLLKTIELDGNEFSDAHYAAFRTLVESKLPALSSLNFALNDDVEDNATLDAIGMVLEGRGGSLILEEETKEEVDVSQLAAIMGKLEVC
ncbi:RNI-like protein [Fistulina hepatica ATCC 64428]|uniref:RNI-like protein n=1 Tax=Fistulina hepatica ATCC 64428 TaxID=1128425 RepID=A0A0D7AFR5_9AGAR|nr:RNI-like protein [Fistulina hepatica ATCC 64428]